MQKGKSMTHQASVNMRIDTDWKEELAECWTYLEEETPTLGHYLEWLESNEHTQQDLDELPAGFIATLNGSSLYSPATHGTGGTDEA